MKCLYLQGGGPTSVINNSFLGIKESILEEDELYVSEDGFYGLVRDTLLKIEREDDYSFLKDRPSSFFRSSRLNLRKDPSSLDKIIETVKKHGFDVLFINGGNDTMNNALILSTALKEKGMDTRVIGIPKTIDNDLPCIDHTPGFISAANFIIECTKSMYFDNETYEKGRINILETMGRDNGSLAASSIYASKYGCRPDMILIPEYPVSLEEVIEKAISIFEEKHRCTIVVSEGVQNKEGRLLFDLQSGKDAFGNANLGGVSISLEHCFLNRGYPSRSIQTSILQRSFISLATDLDKKEAYELSREAFNLAKHGCDKVMASLKRVSSSPYEVEYLPVPLENVLTPVSLESKYIREDGYISDDYIGYLSPLLG